jgi:CshA-type fibril repeat protein
MLVQPCSSVSFTTVTGAGGLGTSGGPPFITTNTTTATGLCPVGTVLPGQVANCTATSVTVTGQGTYTLNRSTGVVTYAALANATTGSKTPIQYVVRDGVTSSGRTDWASGTLTPRIPGPPVAADDTSSGGWDATQTVNVLGNDSADPGQSLVASSVRLCGPGDVSPACDDTTVTTAQGTFTVNLTTGAVTFDPLPTFSGVVTPITYTVTDSQGLKDPASLSFTVAAPGLPAAGDDTVLVTPGQVVSFDPLMGSGGLSTSGGPALSSVCLWVSGACDADDTVVVSGGVYRLDPETKVVSFTE